MKNLGILLSGRGSNFEAIARKVEAGRIPARIAVVISNREDAAGLARAREMRLETRFVPSQGKSREAYDREVVTALKEFRVDLVCLAGFMRVLSPYFVREFPGRILNIHPALLPAFPGLEAQKQALEAGVKFSGCTVHIVDEGVDTGPIVCQSVVPVLDDDTVETLSARILKKEHRIYSEAIALLLGDRIRIEGRRVLTKRP
jgi:phosphoribosylglycinamide formyltransferase 1